MIRYILRFVSSDNRDRGTSTLEYGLLTATIAAMVVSMAFVLGQLATDRLADSCGTLWNCRRWGAGHLHY